MAEFDGNAFLQALAARLKAGMDTGEIAHLKMTFSPNEGNDIAVINLVRNDTTAELSHSLQAPLMSGQLILNMRAEDDPEQLWVRAQAALEAAAGEFHATTAVEQHEFFRRQNQVQHIEWRLREPYRLLPLLVCPGASARREESRAGRPGGQRTRVRCRP